jgi:flagellar hook-length control protein FliK
MVERAVNGRETLEADTDRFSAGMAALDKKAESVAQALAPSSSPQKFSEVLSEQATSIQAMTPNLAANTMGKLESNPALSAVTSSEITTAFGKTDWNQAVNQKVVWMVGAGEQSATLTLNPPDLGPLQVVIQVDNQHVDTTFISDNPAVRQALEDGMSMLRDKMSESGMSLGQAQVNSGEQSQREARQHAQEASRQRANASNTVQDDTGTPSTPTARHVRNGLVDTFA